MKTNKYIQYIILNFIFLIFTNSIYSQEWQATDPAAVGVPKSLLLAFQCE